MKFVDLSHTLHAGMAVYPGDPDVEFSPALSIATDGVAVERLGLGSHAGTHLDAPSHVVVGGRTVDEIEPGLLWGDAWVVRITDAHASTEIPAVDASVLPAGLPSIVCISTGWDAHFGMPMALAHPYLSRGFVEQLWERGARVLCVDTMSPDATDPTDGELQDAGMPVHDFWLGRDGVIVENLRGLSEIPDRIELSILPLKLDGVDGSPVRAIARFEVHDGHEARGRSESTDGLELR
ncbi:cyclase family protein [Leucobacter sp. 1207-22]|uniref:cyclase family protein n=1 Tax=Leucobacter sp. 1207-22 TaxID=2604456 RepID=UPI004063A81E